MEQTRHLALPLKYRPMTFDDVIGQEHVVKTLRNALAAGRIANAYLFIGPRGIGKTTLSRIFAKAANCKSPVGVEPCGKCDNCLEIAAGRSLDVVELDAASHNKVEDVARIVLRVPLIALTMRQVFRVSTISSGVWAKSPAVQVCPFFNFFQGFLFQNSASHSLGRGLPKPVS